MKKFILAAALLMFASAANAEYYGAAIYSGWTTPGGGYTSDVASKQGTATCKNIFFIVSKYLLLQR